MKTTVMVCKKEIHILPQEMLNQKIEMKCEVKVKREMDSEIYFSCAVNISNMPPLMAK